MYRKNIFDEKILDLLYPNVLFFMLSFSDNCVINIHSMEYIGQIVHWLPLGWNLTGLAITVMKIGEKWYIASM